jgi:hypothetical protein
MVISICIPGCREDYVKFIQIVASLILYLVAEVSRGVETTCLDPETQTGSGSAGLINQTRHSFSTSGFPVKQTYSVSSTVVPQTATLQHVNPCLMVCLPVHLPDAVSNASFPQRHWKESRNSPQRHSEPNSRHHLPTSCFPPVVKTQPVRAVPPYPSAAAASIQAQHRLR